jgi:hypothetical protein
MIQKANVKHGATKVEKIVKRRELPCIRRSSSLHSGWVIRGAELMPMERKKRDEQAQKKQRNGFSEKCLL